VICNARASLQPCLEQQLLSLAAWHGTYAVSITIDENLARKLLDSEVSGTANSVYKLGHSKRLCRIATWKNK
jgi:hypothetical protein